MYAYYLSDKRCTEITVEEPSDDFQQLKDALDIKLIWEAGFFKSIRKMIKLRQKGQKPTKVLVNKDNFDLLALDQEEILEIQQALKLKKQNILRCFELVVLSKLDSKDPIVH